MVTLGDLAEEGRAVLEALLDHYGLRVGVIAPGEPIPGSHWGDPEAGLIANQVFARTDTPVHSLLHESCHYICMDTGRRGAVHTDAGGGYDEENAVCYLSILIADRIPGLGLDRMLTDMDRWGYSFRLGSARAWFKEDASDARDWLVRHGRIDAAGELL